MKISIGFAIQDGSWGGGNNAIKAIKSVLIEHGHDVVHHLKDNDIDVIILTEPRSRLKSSLFSDKDIAKYLITKPNTLVVHRVNECDERKNTTGVNKRLRCANLVVDSTVFVSNWLLELHINQGWPCKNNIAIHNGSDPSIFYPPQDKVVDSKIKLVTHHWGGNWEKGFDLYQAIDRELANEDFSNKYEFIYIGNLPEGFQFKHATHIPSLSGQELANKLRKCSVYVTASQNEPGSNHQNEGALCGLPVLYIPSASMDEYLKKTGYPCSLDNWKASLIDLCDHYDQWKDKVIDHPFTSHFMANNYLNHLELLFKKREELLRQRKAFRLITWSLSRLFIKKRLL